MDTKEIKNELTDEQLWQLCLEQENKRKVVESTYRDKAVDYEYERLMWNKWNPRDLK